MCYPSNWSKLLQDLCQSWLTCLDQTQARIFGLNSNLYSTVLTMVRALSTFARFSFWPDLWFISASVYGLRWDSHLIRPGVGKWLLCSMWNSCRRRHNRKWSCFRRGIEWSCHRSRLSCGTGSKSAFFLFIYIKFLQRDWPPPKFTSTRKDEWSLRKPGETMDLENKR